jgi:TetR/AcrR family transcriptional repressor of nem operon
MRRSRQQTEETRNRIVTTASEAFRDHGISETGLKDLMQGAGLETPGGFYKHFGSKDQLVTEAIGFSISELLDRMEASVADVPPEEALDKLVTNYLSPKHRDRVSGGCPFSALGSELRRSDGATVDITAAGLKDYIALIARQIRDVPADFAKKRATAIISAMVGGVILSRIANTATLSNAILRDTREFLLEEQGASHIRPNAKPSTNTARSKLLGDPLLVKQRISRRSKSS